MNQPPFHSDLPATDPQTLLRIMDVPSDPAPVWKPDDLAAILRHQWKASLADDLERIIPAAAECVEVWANKISPPIVTFAELLDHAAPPVDLLVLVKEFAKVAPTHPENPIPRDVAAVIYFAAIEVARRRCGRRISSLSDASLADSRRWALAQPWIDVRARLFLGPVAGNET